MRGDVNWYGIVAAYRFHHCAWKRAVHVCAGREMTKRLDGWVIKKYLTRFSFVHFTHSSRSELWRCVSADDDDVSLQPVHRERTKSRYIRSLSLPLGSRVCARTARHDIRSHFKVWIKQNWNRECASVWRKLFAWKLLLVTFVEISKRVRKDKKFRILRSEKCIRQLCAFT